MLRIYSGSTLRDTGVTDGLGSRLIMGYSMLYWLFWGDIMDCLSPLPPNYSVTASQKHSHRVLSSYQICILLGLSLGVQGLGSSWFRVPGFRVQGFRA